jgi:hypothetical protein
MVLSGRYHQQTIVDLVRTGELAKAGLNLTEIAQELGIEVERPLLKPGVKFLVCDLVDRGLRQSCVHES